MGYLTTFTLEVSTKKQDILESIQNDLDDITGYDWDMDLTLYHAKWYTSHEDMLAISKKYPKLLFTLSGEGEESGDLWRHYYKNGKTQKAHVEITYEEFDPEKLQ